jgi:hypothetical protein
MTDNWIDPAEERRIERELAHATYERHHEEAVQMAVESRDWAREAERSLYEMHERHHREQMARLDRIAAALERLGLRSG